MCLTKLFKLGQGETCRHHTGELILEVTAIVCSCAAFVFGNSIKVALSRICVRVERNEVGELRAVLKGRGGGEL